MLWPKALFINLTLEINKYWYLHSTHLRKYVLNKYPGIETPSNTIESEDTAQPWLLKAVSLMMLLFLFKYFLH